MSADTLDVAIVGAGIVGCACARAASRAGLRVAVFEGGRVGAGATAAAMGHLVTIDDDPAEFALARLSMRLWRDWDGWQSIERRNTGTLWLAEDDAQRHAALAKRARLQAAGLQADWLAPDDLAAAEPRLARNLAGALRVAGDEVAFGPEMAARLAADVRAAGGRVEEMRPVAALHEGGLRLADGSRVSAGHVLLAAGCASARLWPADSPLPLRPRKGHLVITDRHPGTVRHALVELGYIAAAHADADESVAFNAQPRASGQVLLGSSRSFADTTPDVDVRVMARMLRRAQRFLPGIGALQMLRCWAGFRPATPDGRPLIGRVPGRDRLWVATGHEGLGLTTATGSAAVWLDLLRGRTPEIDPAPYDPARFERALA